jgi:hypothetical protein
LPLLFIVTIFLRRYNFKNTLVLFALVFLPLVPLIDNLKMIGINYKTGANLDFSELYSESVEASITGQSGDMSFLEQNAAVLSAVNSNDNFFYFETYQHIFLFFIPRYFWEDKPRLGQWLVNLSSSDRDFGELGQIGLLSGESYSSFGVFGVIVVGFLFSYLSKFFYRKFSIYSSNSLGFYFLLLYNIVLFQVWRDGLISFVVFPLLNFLPLTLFLYVKYLSGRIKI